MHDNWVNDKKKNAEMLKLIKVLQKLMLVGNFNRKRPIVIKLYHKHHSGGDCLALKCR